MIARIVRAIALVLILALGAIPAAAQAPLAVVLNDERLMVRSETPGSGHLALAEFHH